MRVKAIAIKNIFTLELIGAINNHSDANLKNESAPSGNLFNNISVTIPQTEYQNFLQFEIPKDIRDVPKKVVVDFEIELDRLFFEFSSQDFDLDDGSIPSPEDLNDWFDDYVKYEYLVLDVETVRKAQGGGAYLISGKATRKSIDIKSTKMFNMRKINESIDGIITELGEYSNVEPEIKAAVGTMLATKRLIKTYSDRIIATPHKRL